MVTACSFTEDALPSLLHYLFVGMRRIVSQVTMLLVGSGACGKAGCAWCCRPIDIHTPLLGSRASAKGLRGRMSSPAGGLLPRGSTATSKQPGSGMLKSRATWAPGTAQPGSQGILQPRKSAKACLFLQYSVITSAVEWMRLSLT